jgi:hypothetical protein
MKKNSWKRSADKRKGEGSELERKTKVKENGPKIVKLSVTAPYGFETSRLPYS